MKAENIERIVNKSKEKLYKTCGSCSNCNGRDCGTIDVKLSLSHEDFRDVFGDSIYHMVLSVRNLPFDRKTNIKKVLDENRRLI